MQIAFLGQPFDDRNRLGILLRDALAQAESFWVLAAWAQVSGLRFLGSPLRGLRSRGGRSELIVGIDGGIATREGLDLANELFDTVDVFHDIEARTYHPKIFCVECEDKSVVIVGSSNLTEGGLFRNYEGNISLTLNHGNPQEARLLEDVRAFRDQFRSPDMPSRRLDSSLLQELSKAGAFAGARNERSREELIRQEKVRSLAQAIFGRRRRALSSSPPISERASRSSLDRPRRARAKPSTLSPGEPDLAWWKQLTRSDAIRKDQRSHQRNYVILGKAGFEIDQKVWFRYVFFDRVRWTQERMRTGPIKEVAEVPFEVIVADEPLGTFDVRIDHATNRIASQNNAPTWLHWSSLMELIRRDDFTGWYLELEKHPGSYRLRLSKTRPSRRAIVRSR
jgi:HKD family nuclease